MATLAAFGDSGAIGTASFRVQVERFDAHAVISCAGRLASDCGPERLVDIGCAELSHGREVVIDLGGVTGLDAGGLGAIARLWESALAAGRSMAIVQARPRIRRLLEVAFGRSVALDGEAP